MGLMRSVVSGIKALMGKSGRNHEINEELQAYLEEAIADKMRGGMSREEAARLVRREIGSAGVVQHKVWNAGWEAKADRVWFDLMYTLRRLMRTPGLVLAVTLSIGLGLGANATIFSLVSKFVLAPPPVGDPKTLISIDRTYDNGACCNALPYPVYRDIREQAKSFSDVAAFYDYVPSSVGQLSDGKGGGREPERAFGQAASANYFEVAQLGMARGRGFLESEEKSPVVVIGYRIWQRVFQGDPAIVGKVVLVGGQPFTVVGVAPPKFRGIGLVLDPEFWVPLGMLSQVAATAPDQESRHSQWLHPVGRLRVGITLAQAQAEMVLLGNRLAALHPETDKGDGFHLERAGGLPPQEQKDVFPFLAGLLIVVLLVLCIACANVANLLLAQGAKRQREMAVRLALGASRARLLRQMLLESTVLAIAGGLVGVVLSVWATYALSSFRLPVPIPLDLGVGVDWRVLVYTFALSLVAGVVCGFVPAWKASRPVMQRALKGEDALARPGRKLTLRNVLVVAQIGLSLVLLCGAGLFLRSLEGAAKIDVGFRARGVLIVAIDPPSHDYPAARMIQMLREVRERVLSQPGVMSATTTDGVPLSMGHRSDGFDAEGEPAPLPGESSVEMYMAGPQYFQTMGIPLLMGRAIGDENPAAPKVAVISQDIMRRYFHGKNPIGRRMKDGDTFYEVVGVVKDTKSRTIGEDQRPVLYRSINQAIGDNPSPDGYQFMVRYEGDAGALAEAVRRVIHGQDANLAVFNVQTMEEHMQDTLFLPRFLGTLFTVFASIGLLLASVGLYGVMSYAVSQRTKEIGIRMALGAEARAVQKMVVRGGMKLALIAVVLGLPVALGAARLATSMLYGVRPYDVGVFATVPLMLLAVALVACWIPSRRASRVDPMVALRVD
jgi:predicted permease